MYKDCTAACAAGCAIGGLAACIIGCLVIFFGLGSEAAFGGGVAMSVSGSTVAANMSP
jgi:hypothetical protein